MLVSLLKEWTTTFQLASLSGCDRLVNQSSQCCPAETPQVSEKSHLGG